jgi:hypothetical protein
MAIIVHGIASGKPSTAYVSIRQHTSADVFPEVRMAIIVHGIASGKPSTAYVSIR